MGVEPFHTRIIEPIRAGKEETVAMRSVLLWLIGIPIPIILLLAFCTHHF
jgi:hypothetical protein